MSWFQVIQARFVDAKGEERGAWLRVDFTGIPPTLDVFDGSPGIDEMTFQIGKLQDRIERDHPGIIPTLEWTAYTRRVGD